MVDRDPWPCHSHWERDSGISKLDQIIFAGYTHDAVDEVAERLLKLAPVGLDYRFSPMADQPSWIGKA
ncbi:hypothetical protein [Bradyrhizobium ivorense]|uniref:hypothetical protein n=1 Tax=Bradyrhizobium ivorense TaxID=2511166 RepID=UPI00111E6C25|nr:hypothetical protein [Bradyrhizobium ivorense]